MSQVTFEDIHGPSMFEIMERNGLTVGKLIEQLKKELKAKSKKTVKVRGAVGSGQLKNGHKVVAVSGYVVETKDGKELYGTGETVLESSEPNWDIRQRARMDAQKLMGLYPAEKHEEKVDQTVNVTITKFSEDIPDGNKRQSS